MSSKFFSHEKKKHIDFVLSKVLILFVNSKKNQQTQQHEVVYICLDDTFISYTHSILFFYTRQVLSLLPATELVDGDAKW